MQVREQRGLLERDLATAREESERLRQDGRRKVQVSEIVRYFGAGHDSQWAVSSQPPTIITHVLSMGESDRSGPNFASLLHRQSPLRLIRESRGEPRLDITAPTSNPTITQQ